MAAKPKKFKVTMTNGKTATVTAETMKRDGSGWYFYDKDGGQVANWYDGEVKSAMEEGAVEMSD